MQLTAEKEKLALLIAAISKLEQSLQALVREKADAISFVQTQPAMGSTELRALSAFLLSFGTRMDSMREAIKRTNDQVAAQRQRVLEADRNERLLIKLKDKRLAEWRHAADHELEILAEESWNSAHGPRR